MGYMGAKSGAGVYQAIIALMPPHDTYIEPFAGSGAVAARKAPAARSILVDKDASAVAALQAWAPYIPGDVELLQADALAFLAQLDTGAIGRVLIYADPPYLHAVRSSARRYRHELADTDHVELGATLRRLGEAGAAVIVSGYPSTLYDELYEGWRVKEFQAMTRGGVRTEKLWFNFEPGAAHFATFAGRNFTDRQRIKRKAARWAANFSKLPDAERQAVLAALLELA